MRALAWFLAAILGSLMLAALLAWPAWLATQSLGGDWQFHRVVGRLWQVLLLAGLLIALRRLDIRGRHDWGFGLPRPAFLRQTAVGFAVGVCTMLPMTVAMIASGLLRVRPELGPELLAHAIFGGLLAGLGVAIVEEAFFRGVMYRALERESGFRMAAWGTAIVYSAIHFFARTKIPADEVGADSGLRLLGGAFAHFVDPVPILGSFATLLLVGLLLAYVRRRTGTIAAPIGLHMGWVFVMKATIVTTHANPEATGAYLVGAFDGYTGWLVAGWAAVLVAFAGARGWLRPATPPAP